MKYYYSIDGSDVAGPYSLEELTRLFATGTLTTTSQVCTEGQNEWQPVSSVIDTHSTRHAQAAVTVEVFHNQQSRLPRPNPSIIGKETDTEGIMPLAQRFPEYAEPIKWMFVGTTGFFLLGVLWPLITIKKHVGWWIFTIVDESNTVSLASGLVDLFSNGHLFLFCVIFAFSIAFPTLKLGVLLVLWYRGVKPTDESRWLHRLAVTGKWSMLDVLVVSLLVVILKLGDLVAVEVHLGVFFFALSVILSMLITARVVKLTSAAHDSVVSPNSSSQITRDRRNLFAKTVPQRARSESTTTQEQSFPRHEVPQRSQPNRDYSPPPRQPEPIVPVTVQLARWSLCLGVAGLLFGVFTGLPAVYCGHRAMALINSSNGAFTGSGYAKTGLVLGYLSIGLTAIILVSAMFSQ